MRSTEDLAAIIRAGLDADEALALEAPGNRWHIGSAVDPTQPCNVHTFPEARGVADGLNWLVAEHIARHNPARVLAEVASKRALLDEALGWKHDRDPVNGYFCCHAEATPDEYGCLRPRADGQPPYGPCTCSRDARVHAVLTHLAQPYQEVERG